jgi:iron uptake system EfeUOB component EfeO/EfeM
LQEQVAENIQLGKLGTLPAGTEVNQMMNYFLNGIKTTINIQDENLIVATLFNAKNKNFEFFPHMNQEKKEYFDTKLESEVTSFMHERNLHMNQIITKAKKRRKAILLSESNSKKPFHIEDLNQYINSRETYENCTTFCIKNMHKLPCLSKYAFYQLCIKLCATYVERRVVHGIRSCD